MKRLKWVIGGLLAIVIIAVAVVGVYVYRQLNKDTIELGRTQSELVFISDRDGDWDINMLYPDGNQVNLTQEGKGQEFFFSIAFNGKVINLYSTETGKIDPAQVKTDGSNYHTMKLAEAMMSVIKDGLIDMAPAWSPGGEKMVWISVRDLNIELYEANADGSGQQRLTHDNADDTMASWSPTGKQIAFISTRAGGKDVFVLDLETGETLQLTNDPADDYQPVWSLDGDKIMFLRDIDNALLEGKFICYVINSDGSGLRPLGEGEVFKGAPTYAPDGKQVAFMSNEDGYWHIYVMNPDGSDVRRVTEGESNNMFPAWRPIPADQQEAEPTSAANN